MRSTPTREDQYLAHVDERERRHSRHNVFHEQRYALGVVDQIRFSCSSYGDEPRIMYGLTTKSASGCEAETNRLPLSGDRSRHALRAAALSRLHFFLLLRCGIRRWPFVRRGRGVRRFFGRFVRVFWRECWLRLFLRVAWLRSIVDDRYSRGRRVRAHARQNDSLPAKQSRVGMRGTVDAR